MYGLTTAEKFAFTFLGLMLLSMVYLIFVMLPLNALAEEKCLEAGYPKATVTWNYKRYCMNLEGTVTVKIEQL